MPIKMQQAFAGKQCPKRSYITTGLLHVPNPSLTTAFGRCELLGLLVWLLNGPSILKQNRSLMYLFCPSSQASEDGVVFIVLTSTSLSLWTGRWI
jgi:hypothetical protein